MKQVYGYRLIREKKHTFNLSLENFQMCPVAGVFELPGEGEVVGSVKPRVPVSLICDQVVDPHEMAMILQCAVTSGCQQVLTTKGEACGGSLEWCHT